MLKKPVYANIQHQIILQDYFDLILTSINEVTEQESKVKDFIDVANVIIDHHNNYRKGTHEGNWLDFLSIIPTHFSIMISGYLCGLETKENRKEVRAYRLLLSDYGFTLVDRLQKIQIENE
tara:strand:- start:8306 stop:8668 length:363 start_codon:yes stop_codon:yes gene_type:complete